jgi:hypothetical protein
MPFTNLLLLCSSCLAGYWVSIALLCAAANHHLSDITPLEETVEQLPLGLLKLLDFSQLPRKLRSGRPKRLRVIDDSCAYTTPVREKLPRRGWRSKEDYYSEVKDHKSTLPCLIWLYDDGSASQTETEKNNDRNEEFVTKRWNEVRIQRCQLEKKARNAAYYRELGESAYFQGLPLPASIAEEIEDPSTLPRVFVESGGVFVVVDVDHSHFWETVEVKEVQVLYISNLAKLCAMFLRLSIKDFDEVSTVVTSIKNETALIEQTEQPLEIVDLKTIQQEYSTAPIEQTESSLSIALLSLRLHFLRLLMSPKPWRFKILKSKWQLLIPRSIFSSINLLCRSARLLNSRPVQEFNCS